MKTHVDSYIKGLKTQLDTISPEKVESLVQMMLSTADNCGTIYIAGNGGSAATSSHFVCDIKKTVLGKAPKRVKKGRFKVVSLNDNIPLLTAWANDSSYDDVFSEPLLNFAEVDDLFIVITGSGNSKNIVKAVKTAKKLKVKTFGLLGFNGGLCKDLLDDHITIPSNNYGHIEDAHMILVHLVTDYLKQRFNEKK
ncbi:MAG: SIS domain-containing protein [Patescibacteria group bacterium]